MFEKIKRWYKQGLWTENMVNNAVSKGVLTEKQAEEILRGEE
jgi:hypothetical protein